MFAVSDDGRIIKAINVANPDGDPQVRSVVIEELQVLRPGTVVRSLNIVRVEGQPDKLLIVSDDVLQTIPLQRCTSSKITNCRCVPPCNTVICINFHHHKHQQQKKKPLVKMFLIRIKRKKKLLGYNTITC